MADIEKNITGTFVHGRKSSIGASALQLTSTSSRVSKGVVVKAAVGNSGKVYVGLSNVTADSADATDGFELAAGESIAMEIDDPSKVYVIGSAASQKVFWFGI